MNHSRPRTRLAPQHGVVGDEASVEALRRSAGDYLMTVLPGSTFASARAPVAALLNRTLTALPRLSATVAVHPGVVAMLSTLTCCVLPTVVTRTRRQPAAAT